ncbi:dipeptide/oligopeptide/nickel ABC transporter permease/ATP-binding protein [Streptomyces sp. cg40]|uniref:dipeptide/oligopeptide/nickel ABC transporter permease/ATP-binding protein n=1 Tax=Streptomyces sp. cg40 TaxID=3419764 RepID=UPI003CFD41D7
MTGTVAGLIRRPATLLALILLALILVACVAAPLVAPHQPNQVDYSASLQGPSTAHWLGTDQLGRDTYSRLLYGGRVSLMYAAVVAAVTLAVGLAAGLLSGYLGGWTDRVIMSITDVGLAIPVLVVVIVVLSVFQQNFLAVMIALGLLLAPFTVRSVRAPVLAVREELFVDAARVSGLPALRIMVRHVLPRVAGPVLVQATLVSAMALQMSVGLAYLGFGPKPPNPTWGSMISEGSQVLASNGWLLLASGGTVALVTVCLGFVGDGLRDATVQAWTGEVTGTARRRRRPVPTAIRTRLPQESRATSQTDGPDLLVAHGLSIGFGEAGRETPTVSGLEFAIGPGEAVGLVGESGCGKTSVARAVLALLPDGGRVTGGEIWFDDQDVTGLSARQMAAYRGKSVGYVGQEPMAALDPAVRVGTLLRQVVRTHSDLTRAQAHDRVIELLEMVHIPDPAAVARRYPHQLSGGMAQRVAIARAIASGPRLLIADEPTTALDVTVQAQILALLRELQQRLGMAVLLVSHDWAVVAQVCQRAMVMYAGQLLEEGTVEQLVSAPAHPYTRALLACRPASATEGQRLPAIPGQVPAPGTWPAGCRFAARCAHSLPKCTAGPVGWESLDDGHASRCLRTGELAKASDLSTAITTKEGSDV